MTVAEARELFNGHPKFGDPKSMEAHRILREVEEVKELLRKRGEFVKSKPKPGSALAGKLMHYSADVVETAFREVGIKEEEKKETVLVPAAEEPKQIMSPLKWTTEDEQNWLSNVASTGQWNVLRGWLFAATHYARNWAGMDRWRLIAHAATLLADRKRKAQQEEMAEEVLTCSRS